MQLIRRLETPRNVRVHRLVYDSECSQLYGGFSDGSLRVWNCDNFNVVYEYDYYTSKTVSHSSSQHGVITTGLIDLCVTSDCVYLCGNDGSVKMMRKKQRLKQRPNIV